MGPPGEPFPAPGGRKLAISEFSEKTSETAWVEAQPAGRSLFLGFPKKTSPTAKNALRASSLNPVRTMMKPRVGESCWHGRCDAGFWAASRHATRLDSNPETFPGLGAFCTGGPHCLRNSPAHMPLDSFAAPRVAEGRERFSEVRAGGAVFCAGQHFSEFPKKREFFSAPDREHGFFAKSAKSRKTGGPLVKPMQSGKKCNFCPACCRDVP